MAFKSTRWINFPNQKPPLGCRIDWSHPLAKKLVACWVVNEESGGALYDLASSYNVNFTVSPQWVGGRVKLSSATGTKGNIQGNPFSGMGKITILGKGNFPASDASIGILGGWTSDTDMSCLLFTASDDKLYWRVRTTSTVTISTVDTIQNGTDTVFCADYNGSTLSIDFLNKSKTWSGGSISGQIASYSGQNKLGYYGAASTTNGSIEFLYVFKDVLTRDEKDSLYTNPYQFILAPLRNWYVTADGGLTQVDSDFAALFDIRGQINSDFAAAFDIRQTVNSDFQAVYQILTEISTDFQSKFDILNTVSSDFACVYDVRQTIESDLEVVFDIRQLTDSDLQILYDMGGQVSSDFEVRFDLGNQTVTVRRRSNLSLRLKI